MEREPNLSKRRDEDKITDMRDEVTGETYKYEREPYTLTADDTSYVDTGETSFNMLGVVLAILGVIMLLATVTSSLVSVSLLGTLLAIGALVQLTVGVQSRNAGATILSVLLALIYGAMAWLLISQPILGTISLTQLLAIFFATAGIVRTVASFMERRENIGWSMFAGIVELALGVMLWNVWPFSGLYAIGLFLGIDLLVSGVVLMSATNQEEELF